MRSMFLSHTGKDKDVARVIYHQLNDRGLRVWFDEAEIGPTDSIREAIGSALDDVDCLGVLLTPSSLTAPWVLDELKRADWVAQRAGRIKILPLLLVAIGEVPPFLRDTLGIDLTADFTAGVDRIAGYLLEETQGVEMPPQGRMAQIMRAAGQGRWQRWTAGRIERAAAADAVTVLRRPDFTAAVEVARCTPTEALRVTDVHNVVRSVIRSGATTEVASAQRIARRLVDDVGLLADAEDGVPGNLVATPLTAAVAGAARRGGFHSNGGRVGDNPERLSELLEDSIATNHRVHWLTGPGWTAATFGTSVEAAPAVVQISTRVFRATTSRERRVRTVVWTHERSHRTWLFPAARSTDWEMLEGHATLEDLGVALTSEQRAALARTQRLDRINAQAISEPVAYPEVTLEVFDDLHVLRH